MREKMCHKIVEDNILKRYILDIHLIQSFDRALGNVLNWWNIRNGIWIICYHIDRFNHAYVSSPSNTSFLQTSEGAGDLFSTHKCKLFFYIYPHITFKLVNKNSIKYKSSLSETVLSPQWTSIPPKRSCYSFNFRNRAGFFPLCLQQHSCLWLLSVLPSAIEWNLEACSPLWLHIWIQMCLSQVVNFLSTQLCAMCKKKDKKRKFRLNFAPLWVLPGGNFDKLTQVCFGGGSKFQSQYIYFTKAKRLCIATASKQEIKRSLIAEFDNFLYLPPWGDPVIGRVNC